MAHDFPCFHRYTFSTAAFLEAGEDGQVLSGQLESASSSGCSCSPDMKETDVHYNIVAHIIITFVAAMNLGICVMIKVWLSICFPCLKKLYDGIKAWSFSTPFLSILR